MYIDDIKLFAKNEKELETLQQSLKIFCRDIKIEFGIEKCAMLITKSDKQQTTEGIELPNQEKIKTLGEKETWEYWKRTPSNTRRWKKKKKRKKSTSGEREN